MPAGMRWLGSWGGGAADLRYQSGGTENAHRPGTDRMVSDPPLSLRPMPSQRLVPTAWRAPAAIALAYLLSRLGFFLAGVRLNTIGIVGHQYPQQLDLALLKSQPITSLWHLHSQPPLFNLVTGFLVRLPVGLQQPAVVFAMLLLGLVLVLSCYYLCIELGIPQWLAVALSVLVILDPAYVLYEGLFYYTYPTSALITFTALCLARYLRTKGMVWGILFVGSVSVVVLMNSTFQWVWLVLCIVPVAVAVKRDWRKFLAVAAVPLLLVSFWYAKNAVLFSTYSTSSWLGMNLEKITTAQATSAERQSLVNEGTLTPIVALPAFFTSIPGYVPRYSNHPLTGVAVLDQKTKSDGTPNFNNINIISVANQYLKNDVGFIAARPKTYARSVASAFTLFMVPSDQYFICWHGEEKILPYVRAYDLLVEGQVYGTSIQTMWTDANQSSAPSAKHISVLAVMEIGATVCLLPILVWRRRRNHAVMLTMGFIWVTTVYVLVVTNFVELGENNRFRFDLGPLPLIALALSAMAVVHRIRSKTSSNDSFSAGSLSESDS